jgi:hypothetical protein
LTTQDLVVLPPPPAPTPVPPPGPGPTPGPNPPPTPTPTKLRALFLYDPATLDKLTEAQREIIYSVQPGSVLDYVTTHALTDTVTDAEGGTHTVSAWRRLPTTSAPTAFGALWAPLFTAAKGTPGIIVQSGDNVTRFDLPATAADALKLLTPLGGN